MITVTVDGNLLSIAPALTHLFAEKLTYKHTAQQIAHYDVRRNMFVGDKVVSVDQPLYQVVDNVLFTTAGAVDDVLRTLTASGLEYTFVDKFAERLAAGDAETVRQNAAVQPDYDNMVRAFPDLMLRAGQDDVIANIIGRNRGIFVAPTAFGKSFLLRVTVALFPKANIIIAVPSVPLLHGLSAELRKTSCAVGTVGGGTHSPDVVTVCTYQSLLAAPIDKCDILFVDEVHRLPSKKNAVNFARVWKARKRFGVTATPQRGDKAERVAEVLLGPVLCDISYGTAEASGAVAALRHVMLPITDGPENTWQIRIAKKRNLIWRNVWRNTVFTQAVRKLVTELPDAQILILTETAEHAFRLRQGLPEFEVVCRSVSDNSRKQLVAEGLLEPSYKPATAGVQKRLLFDFASAKVKYVIATSTWGTGVDFPHCAVLVNAAGLADPTTVIQWSGRASRRGGGRRFGLVLDGDDVWDKWAMGRSKGRRRIYNSKGWSAVTLDAGIALLKEDAEQAKT